MNAPFVVPFTGFRAAAMALLNAGAPLKQREGQFLGGIAFAEYDELTEKQTNWLRVLLKRHGLPPLADGGGE